MKQSLIFCLLIAIVCFAVPAFATTYRFPVNPAPVSEGELTMEAALSLAQNEMMQREGMPEIQLENYKIKAHCVWLDNGEKAWVVMLDELGYGTDALVTLSATGGHVIHYHATNTEITMYLIEQWTAVKGKMNTWSVKDKALFNWLFGNDEQYVVPDESYIAQEDAEEIAMAAVSQLFASPTASSTFLYMTYPDKQLECYVWSVTIWENGQEVYLVHVNAETGAVVETYQLYGNG